MENFNYSNKVEERATNPLFLLKENDASIEFAPGAENIISFKYFIKNSNGLIEFIGEVEGSIDEKPIKWLKYKTNITGPTLAFIDGAIELCQNKNRSQVASLSVREVESFLRDNNIEPSFPNDATSMYRIFDFTKDLESELGKFLPILKKSDFSSPSFEDYEKQSGRAYDEQNLGPFSELTAEDKHAAVSNVLEMYIRGGLQKDGGGVECVYIMDDMIVINYLGNCGSCGQSLTSTMDFITSVLRSELGDPNIKILTDS